MTESAHGTTIGEGDRRRPPLDTASWNALFDEARSHSTWAPEAVPIDVLRALQRRVFLGPTAFNCEPLTRTCDETRCGRRGG